MAPKGKHISLTCSVLKHQKKLAEAKEAERAAAEREAMLVQKKKEWAARSGEVVSRIKTGDCKLHQQLVHNHTCRMWKKMTLACEAKDIQQGKHPFAADEEECYPMKGIKSVWDDLEHFHAGGFESEKK